MKKYIIKVISEELSGQDFYLRSDGTHTKNQSEAFTTDDYARILKNVQWLNLAHINDKKPKSFVVIGKEN